MSIIIHQRWRFGIGLLLIIVGQFLIASYEAQFLNIGVALWLNDFFHLGMARPETIISGILILLAGAVIVWRSFRMPAAPSLPDLSHLAGLPWVCFVRKHIFSLIVAAALLFYVLVRLADLDRTNGLVFLWIVAVLVLLRVLLFADRERGVRFGLGLGRADWLWIVVLVIAGLIIGAHQLQDIPNNLLGDEGGFYERALSIAQGEERQSFFDVGVYSYPLPSSYFQALFLNVFGFSVFSWRLSSVVAGVLAVIPLYLLARELFDRRTAVLAGVVFISLPYLLAFERMGYNNSQAILPVTLGLYLLYIGLARGSALYVGLGGAAAGLGSLTYTAGRIGMVIAAVFVGLLLLAAGWRWLRSERDSAPRREAAARALRLVGLGLVFGVLSLIIVLPNVVHTEAVAPDLLRYKTLEALLPNTNYGLAMYSSEELFRDNPPVQMGAETFFVRYDLWARLFTAGVFRSLLAMHELSMTNSHFLTAGLAGPVSVVFYVLGLVLCIRGLRQRRFLLLGLWLFLSLLLLSMINTFPARHQHLMPIIPALALLIALGLGLCFDLIAAILNVGSGLATRTSTRGLAAAVASIALVVIVVVTNLRSYFVEVPLRYTPDFENVMAWDALHQTGRVRFIYVYDSPDREFFTPWMILHLPTTVRYETMTSERALSGDFIIDPNVPTAFYFREPLPEEIAAFVQQFEPGTYSTETRTDPSGRVVSVAVHFPPLPEGDAPAS